MKGLRFNALEHHFEANLNVKCCVRATNNQLNFQSLSKSSLTGSWHVTLAVSRQAKKDNAGPVHKNTNNVIECAWRAPNIFCFKSWYPKNVFDNHDWRSFFSLKSYILKEKIENQFLPFFFTDCWLVQQVSRIVIARFLWPLRWPTVSWDWCFDSS